jgi:hypothetical protein
MTTSHLKDVFSTKGLAAEFHVNRTLNKRLGAVRYRGQAGNEPCVFLFDGLVLPYGNHDLTEIDHVLVSRQGIFSIETKSISGRVFGERNAEDWFSANPSSFSVTGLIDRRFTNPFKQNIKHIKAIQEILQGLPITESQWIENVVVFVNANEDGWEPGSWAGKEIKGLFLSGEQLAAHIAKQRQRYSCESVKRIAEKLNHYYLKKDVLRSKFDEKFEQEG